MKQKIHTIVIIFFLICSPILLYFSITVEPILLKKETFVYEFGEDEISTNPIDYIQANEEILDSIKLDFSKVKNEVGTYQVSASYLNRIYPFTIKIEDTKNPIASLKQVQINIEVGEELVAADLLVEDEQLSDCEVYFVNDEEQLETKEYLVAGNYIENIIVVDASNNQSAKLRVKVVVGQVKIMPTIKGADDIVVTVDSHFEPLLGVTGTNGYGMDISDQIKIISNTVDMKKVGEYEVIYSLTNRENNNIQVIRKVVVQE